MIVFQLLGLWVLAAGGMAVLCLRHRHAERDWPAEDAAQMEALKEYDERH